MVSFLRLITFSKYDVDVDVCRIQLDLFAGIRTNVETILHAFLFHAICEYSQFRRNLFMG